MIHYAIDRGVNYLDIGIADSAQDSALQSLLKNISLILQDGYRQQVKYALTLPSRQIRSVDDCNIMLAQTLDYLQEDRIDFLLLGDIDRKIWPWLEGLGILPWAEKAMADGRIGRLGFSFHDDFQSLRTILDAYEKWALCQIRYSFMDIDHHPGIGGIQLAADHGLAVVVSQPLLTGRLVKNIPESVLPIWTDSGGASMATEWGLRWVWNHPQVSTVIVNMKRMSQLMESELAADRYSTQSLSVPEEVNISRVRDAYLKLRPVPCTGCRSCLPCPLNIDVPRIIELWNEAVMFEDPTIPRALYHLEQHHIGNCTECGTCSERCGMNIAIPERLKEAHKILDPETKSP
jgi:predicted aldo/keto reductase-like oxidoreductase